MVKKKWLSFVKARLNCSLPGNVPYEFNELCKSKVQTAPPFIIMIQYVWKKMFILCDNNNNSSTKFYCLHVLQYGDVNKYNSVYTVMIIIKYLC